MQKDTMIRNRFRIWFPVAAILATASHVFVVHIPVGDLLLGVVALVLLYEWGSLLKEQELETCQHCWYYNGTECEIDFCRLPSELGRRLPQLVKKSQHDTCEEREEVGMKYRFRVHENLEPAAGLMFYGDDVIVECDPGGEDGEFEEYMRKALADWYEAEVTLDDRWLP